MCLIRWIVFTRVDPETADEPRTSVRAVLRAPETQGKASVRQAEDPRLARTRSEWLLFSALAGALLLLVVGLWTPAHAQTVDPGRQPRTEAKADEPGRGDRRSDRPTPPHDRADRTGGRNPSEANQSGDSASAIRLTEHQKRLVTGFLAEFLPGVHQEIELLAKTKPRTFERELNYLLPRVDALLRQRAAQPKVFLLSLKIEELEYGIRRKARRIRSLTTPEQQGVLAGELRWLIGEKFDLEQQRSALQLTALSRRLEELRQQLERRSSQREQLVQHEVESRLGSANTAHPPRRRPHPSTGDRESPDPDRPRPARGGPPTPAPPRSR